MKQVDRSGFGNLKTLFRNQINVRKYWKKTGAHALSADDFLALKKQQLYDHTWKIAVDSFIKEGNLSNDKKILDAGCGWGRTVVGLKKFLPEMDITGLDIVPDLLKLARQVLKDETGSNEVKFLVGNVQNLSFPDNSFDAVISTRVLQYVPNPIQAVREFSRVVKPNGRVVVMLPNKMNPIQTLTYHTKLYSPYDLKEWFEEAGLKVIKIGSVGFIPSFYRFNYKSSIVKLNNFIQENFLFKNFGGLSLVCGEK